MIAHLRGQLASTGIDSAVIDVNGVGYLVGASAKTLAALGRVGDTVTIHTELLVSEDSMRFVGFATADERDWFRLLTHVQGVGSKVALAILSISSPESPSRFMPLSICKAQVSLSPCAAQNEAHSATSSALFSTGRRSCRTPTTSGAGPI